MIDFDAIKSRHRIEDVLSKRGLTLHKVSGGYATRCPVHEGTKPKSLFIHANKQWCKCWTECGYIGTVIDLVMALDGAASAVEAAEILEGRPLTDEEMARPKPTRAVRLRLTAERECKELPKFYKGEQRHFEVIARARALPWQAIKMAHEAGHVRFCQPQWDYADSQTGAMKQGSQFNCYAVLDVGNPVNVQFRRMDVDAETGKALTFWRDCKVMGWKGNQASWPVGLDSALQNPRSAIVLVEGTGDYLAAWVIREMGYDIIPIAVFGASNSLARQALPFFERRQVFIIEQHDAACAAAAERWAAQLTTAAAKIYRWRVPEEGADLNDFISSGGDVDSILNTPLLT